MFFEDPQLLKDLEEVRGISLKYAESASPLIRRAVREVICSGGKMLRPSLVILAARYGSWDQQKAAPLAAAVEMLHTATLVHDDIIDNSATRRGRPALHVQIGSGNAVLVGDYLLSCCFSLTASSTSVENGVNLSRAVARICEGEITQNAQRFVQVFSYRDYRRRIAGKTAALFALSLLAGARESGCSDSDCAKFLRVGYSLGMAFQIIDDILDFVGQDDVVGKPLGRDLQEGVYTLPLIIAVKTEDRLSQEAGGGQDAVGLGDPRLRQLLRDHPYDEPRTREILRRVMELGGVDLAREEARLYTRRAEREIARLVPGYTRDMLAQMAASLLSRTR